MFKSLLTTFSYVTQMRRRGRIPVHSAWIGFFIFICAKPRNLAGKDTMAFAFLIE